MKLIKDGRNCAQSRENYGITTLRDAERQKNIADEEYLNAYLECVEDGRGTEDINSRYRFATTRLGSEENQILAGSITASVAGELVGNELYQFYKGGNKEKRRWFRKRKPFDSQDIASFPEENVETGAAPASELEMEQDVRETRETDIGMPESEETQGNDAEDMFAVMERFRMMMAADTDTSFVDTKEADLMILMGNYLRAVDV